MKVIEINSKKNGKYNVLVDDEDYDYINQFTWYLSVTKSGPYARARYIDNGNKRKLCCMHRLILGVTDKSIFVDHVNHNGLDNRRSNLRIASRSQNGMNRRVSKSNKSGYKGVSKSSNSESFRVCIYLSGKMINGGTFKTPEEAAKKYNELARIHHGEFAYQNPV